MLTFYCRLIMDLLFSFSVDFFYHLIAHTIKWLVQYHCQKLKWQDGMHVKGVECEIRAKLTSPKAFRICKLRVEGLHLSFGRSGDDTWNTQFPKAEMHRRNKLSNFRETVVYDGRNAFWSRRFWTAMSSTLVENHTDKRNTSYMYEHYDT